MNTRWRQLRYSARTLARSPIFSLVCILTVALSIGANTAVFSIANSMFLRPLPVKDPSQIIMLAFRQKDGPLAETFSIPELKDLRADTTSVFSEVIGAQLGLDGLRVTDRAERVIPNTSVGIFSPDWDFVRLSDNSFDRAKARFPAQIRSSFLVTNIGRAISALIQA